MKSDAGESSAVIEFVSQISLAYPHLRIRMISNGNMLFSTPGKGDRYKNILTVFSRELGDGLIPVQAEEGNLRLEGYISNPGESRATRKQQIFFVNGRVVDSKVIQKGISQAYADKLFEGRFPIAFLFLAIRPDSLDVNIHPNKREIRFNDEDFVTEFIRKSLREALLSKESIPEVKEKMLFRRPFPEPTAAKRESAAPEPVAAADKIEAEVPPEEEQVNIKKLLSNIRNEEDRREPELREAAAEYQVKPSPEADIFVESSETILPKTPAPFDFDELTITGSIFGTYITAVDESCFYLIDQHAAHERIFFEKLMKQYRQSETYCQPVMLPITLNVSYDVAESQDDWVPHLNRMGFQAEVFGPRTYRIKGIPAFMELEEAERFLKDFTEQAAAGIKIDNLPAIEKIIMRSCKSAVKAHDYLKDEEIRSLFEELKQCENPFSCPHGRPTFIKMTQYEIEKMFKRV